MRMSQQIDTVYVAAPVDSNGAVVSDVFSMEAHEHATIDFIFGNVAADGTITLQQDVDATGTSGADKALDFLEYWTCDVNNDNWVKTEVAAGNTLTVLAASDDNKIVRLEISAKKLDQENLFKYIKASFSGGAGASLVAVVAHLHRGRFQGEKRPSAVV